MSFLIRDFGPYLRTYAPGDRSHPYRKDRWWLHFIFVVFQVERETVMTTRKAEIFRREKREENCQFPREGENKNGNTTVESHLSLNTVESQWKYHCWSKTEEMSTEVDEAFGSLSIDMVKDGDQEISNTGLPPFPRGQALDNWTVVELPVVFKLSNE